MKSRSLFLTFEGGDGSGKTTLMERMQKSLINDELAVIQTREPGGTLLGEQIRNLLLNQGEIPIASKAELLLFLASRVQHLKEVILPALAEEKIVLCDRFNDSSVAYQGVARNLGFDFVKNLCDLACGGIVPDCTFYLDIDPIIGLERTLKASDGRMDRIEKEELAFHKKVRSGFHQIAEREKSRFHLIDATQSKEKVFEQAYSIFTSYRK